MGKMHNSICVKFLKIHENQRTQLTFLHQIAYNVPWTNEE